jgi:hypothetical protein
VLLAEIQIMLATRWLKASLHMHLQPKFGFPNQGTFASRIVIAECSMAYGLTLLFLRRLIPTYKESDMLESAC